MNQQNDPTRRGFLAATGAGAATVATVALAGSAHAGEPTRADRAEAGASHANLVAVGDGPLVVYLTDLASGRITFVAGEQRAVVTDRALAASLARRAGRG
jgi:hypothetical protein